MYIPKYYRLDDRERIGQYLSVHPFGTLVADDGARPIAAHMPFEWRAEKERLVLEAHVARGNPIARVASQGRSVLVIFQGPHSYVSSSWYRDPNVPTWNYVAIHLYGICRELTGEEFEAAMARLLNRYETGRPQGRTWERLDPTFRAQQMRAIVGLSIVVEEIQAAQKMSQNRTDEDFHSIVEHLEGGSLPEQEVAEVMRTVRPHLFDP
ncbi:FMN-binding negative transcriptional regulator [Sulfobacillus harzensis]|uniref:FMN-binding negative transcriptional regulator n=1 Tax=Sulfobacillus harzensis TaxID=2729629 RepID=A0A7Y0Q3X3_9FIRM|nr:FMN-binding negative transcriptional regulator [Sulfobacillus harzensis]